MSIDQHLTERTLDGYVLGGLDAAERARAGEHLEACDACRALLRELDTVASRVRSVPPLAPSERLRARIRRSLDEGALVALPVVRPPRPRSFSRWLAIAAGIVIACIGALVVANDSQLTAAPATGALRFDPATPTPGATIEVVYTPTVALSGERQLHLRARFRSAGMNRIVHRFTQHVAATLQRAPDGTFKGSFTFPDSIVYAAFAVEDRAGRVVDNNLRQLWELLAHDSSGTPLYAALKQREDQQPWTEAYQTALRALALYPNIAQAWSALEFYQSLLLGDRGTDSAKATHKAALRKLHAALSAERRVPPEEMRAMYSYARRLDDTSLARHWETRLTTEAPESREAVTYFMTWRMIPSRLTMSAALGALGYDTLATARSIDAIWQSAAAKAMIDSLRGGEGELPRQVKERLERRSDSLFTAALRTATGDSTIVWGRALLDRGFALARLVHLEAAWNRYPGANDRNLMFHALEIAEQSGDAAAIRRWRDRTIHLPETTPERIAFELTEHPDLREEGLTRLRALLRETERVNHATRRLVNSVEDQRRDDEARRRTIFGYLGRGLIAAGNARGGLDTVALAVKVGWNPSLDREVAAAMLVVGDTAGALRVLARLAVDPAARRDYADSIRRTVARTVPAREWSSLLAGGARDMRERVLSESKKQALGKEIRVADSTGVELPLSQVLDGKVSAVIFWSRFCGPAIDALPEILRVGTKLRAMGANAILVVDEPPSDELRAYLRDANVTVAVYHDARREMASAFDNWGQPQYHVVDADGLLRFSFVRLDELVTRAAVLSPDVPLA